MIIEKELSLILSKSSNLINIIALFIAMLILALFATKDVPEVKVILVWICATFALQMSMHNLFESDYNDGTLEQIFIYNYPSQLAIFLKIFAHWLCFGLPIAVISFVIDAIILGSNSILLILALLLNTIGIVFISAVGCSLTIGHGDSAAISQVLILPMMIPMFIHFYFIAQAHDINVLLIGGLLFIAFIIISGFVTHTAIKFAIQHS
ncbi:heme exporter protein CcmB [Candidatus Mesenet endosymbiont of Agriotes lineatus]|uniref:heme exporter protein CcmB n=1 Tax=Candidatus Mesenet endosymbiont of Agriotes lineatus TaxID=3077948 RepID=UPI0030D3A302